MHLLPVSLAPLADIAAKENSVRFGATIGVQLKVNADNTYTAEATDGRRLVIIDGGCESAADYPAFPALASAPNGECTSIIPAKEWKAAFAAAKKMTARAIKPHLRTCPVVIGKSVTSFGATDLERIAFSQPRNVEGRFPNSASIIPPTEKALLSVRVDPEILASVLDTIDALNVQTDRAGVDIEFHGDARKISIIAIRYHDITQKITAAVVPLQFTDGPAKGKTDARPAPEETDDDPKIPSYKAAIEDLHRRLAHEQQRADYFREAIEETRAAANSPGWTQAEVTNLNERNRIMSEEIEQLRADLAAAMTRQDADTESEYAKMKERAETAEAEMADYDRQIGPTGYDDIAAIVADLHKAEDKAAELENAAVGAIAQLQRRGG